MPSTKSWTALLLTQEQKEVREVLQKRHDELQQKGQITNENVRLLVRHRTLQTMVKL